MTSEENPAFLFPHKCQKLDSYLDKNSSGRPLESTQKDLAMPCNKKNENIHTRREGRQLHLACIVPFPQPALISAKIFTVTNFLLPGKGEQAEWPASLPFYGTAWRSYFGFTPHTTKADTLGARWRKGGKAAGIISRHAAGAQRPTLCSNSADFATEETNNQYSHGEHPADLASFSPLVFVFTVARYLSPTSSLPLSCPHQSLDLHHWPAKVSVASHM